MPHFLTTDYLEDSVALFRYYKSLAERALAQAPDDRLHVALDAESNSISVIIQHMVGNMRSRWTDFLTTDGEKPDRHRDSEFEPRDLSRAELMQLWESGWECLFAALTPLTAADLSRSVTIRGEEHSVMQAINRQMAHYAYHVGQLVFLAKHLSSEHWVALTVPRNRSEEFNRKVKAGEASQR